MTEGAPTPKAVTGIVVPEVVPDDENSAATLKKWIRDNIGTLGESIKAFLSNHQGLLLKQRFTDTEVASIKDFLEKATKAATTIATDSETSAVKKLAAIAPAAEALKDVTNAVSGRRGASIASAVAPVEQAVASVPEDASVTTAPVSSVGTESAPAAPEAVAAPEKATEAFATIESLKAEHEALLSSLAEKGYGKKAGKNATPLSQMPGYATYTKYLRAKGLIRYRVKNKLVISPNHQERYTSSLQQLQAHISQMEIAGTEAAQKAPEKIVVPNVLEADQASAAVLKEWLVGQLASFTPEQKAAFDAALGNLNLLQQTWFTQDDIDAVTAFFDTLPTKDGSTRRNRIEVAPSPVSLDDIQAAIADGKTKFIFTDSNGQRQVAVPYILHKDAKMVVFKWTEGEGENKKQKSDTVELKVVRRVLTPEQYQSADPKVHEKYDELRSKWKASREELHAKGNTYFSTENEEKQKAIAQELQDKSKVLGVPLLGLLFNRKRRKELKLEQAQNAQTYQEYLQAQQTYAQAFKDVLNERKKYRTENTEDFNSYKAQLASRFFAKEGDPQYRYERSYLASELEFNKAILPERKKTLLGNTLGVMQKLSFRNRMLIGGAFAGAVGAATGGTALAGTAMLRYALGATAGTLTSRAISNAVLVAGEPGLRRQRAIVLKTRKESIDMFDPSNFMVSKELMQRTETKLQNKERNNKVAAAALGAGAAFIAGRAAAEGVTEFMASQAIPTSVVSPTVPRGEVSPIIPSGEVSTKIGIGIERFAQTPTPKGGEILQQGTPLQRPQVGDVVPRNPRVVSADTLPKTPGIDNPVQKFAEPTLPKGSLPDTLPTPSEVIPSPYQGLTIPKPGQFETAFFDKWKAGGIKGLPGPDQMSSREFLARMRAAYGELNGNKAVMDIAKVPSNNINLVQPGEMNVQPFIDRMNGVSVKDIEQGLQSNDGSPLAPDVSLRPQPRPSVTPNVEQPKVVTPTQPNGTPKSNPFSRTKPNFGPDITDKGTLA